MWDSSHDPCSSFRKLYKYIPTPMAFLENGTHVLANQAEPYLPLDQNDQHPREMTKDDVAASKMVNYYRRSSFLFMISMLLCMHENGAQPTKIIILTHKK